MIEINDDDVERVAKQLGLLLDVPSVTFLKRTVSCDVHACPGSGKTTLLVAKLALLARAWRWRDRGILVLSHTNVARQTIESRLSQDALASRLFAYPHFIGTIQSFVDRFIAFPYLRDIGINGARISEPRVDDEAFASRAWRWFLASGWRDFKQARAYLKNKRKHDEGLSIVCAMSYTNAALDLNIGEIAGPDSPTGQQLRCLKDGLSAEGLFRYQDMFAFARASISRHPFLSIALRRRFPWVFVDEVQDTAIDQEALIDQLFGSTCVLQKLGDRNQGIFRGEGDDDSAGVTPADALDLPTSHRLAPTIAKFASPLTVVRPQRLVGNPKRQDRTHTVFVFSSDQLFAVLPAFGNLILDEWSELPPGFIAKAVGFRRKELESPRSPGRIADYWPGYRSEVSRDRFTGETLVEFVRKARQHLQVERHFHAAHRTVLDGLAVFIQKQGSDPRLSRPQSSDALRRHPAIDAVRGVIAELLLTPELDEFVWTSNCTRLSATLGADPLAERASAFLKWSVASDGQEIDPVRSRTNIFRHSRNDRSVEIVVSTIHSVKGETHDATLVLETFEYQHDLRTLLPYLSGEATKKKSALGVRVTNFMKRIFVALTRPRELVCLALHRDSLTEEGTRNLRSHGWAICELGSRRDAE